MNILWWGRFGNYGPDYPRNRTLMSCMRHLGWTIEEYRPRVSRLGHLEARLHRFEPPDLVWVPCFRQRDIRAASRWASGHGVPLVIDPLISAYDKRVNEKKKYPPESRKARRVLEWERELFSLADIVIADTRGHAEYFRDILNVDENRLLVIPVGAEESLFFPKPQEHKTRSTIPEVLFFGTFISLQGPQVITKAIDLYEGPPVKWRFLGKGPLRSACEQEINRLKASKQTLDVRFEDWIEFEQLAERIRQADILLGVFGEGEKTARVIPNKVYQGMACGKPVITSRSDVYPEALLNNPDSGITWVDANNPQQLGQAVASLAGSPEFIIQEGDRAYRSYVNYFSNEQIIKSLRAIQDKVSRHMQ